MVLFQRGNDYYDKQSLEYLETNTYLGISFESGGIFRQADEYFVQKISIASAKIRKFCGKQKT